MDSDDISDSAHSPMRVFLVEDNPEHSFIAVKVLQQLLGDGSEVIAFDPPRSCAGNELGVAEPDIDGTNNRRHEWLPGEWRSDTLRLGP